MSEYREVHVCQDCKTKSIYEKGMAPRDICFNCGSHKINAYLEKDYKGAGLHEFLNEKVDHVGK